MVRKNKISTKYEIADELIIEDLDTLKVLADPRRIRIIKTIGTEPKTVKDISEALDIPAGKLYYHINMLEKNGLIQIADTRVVSGIIEKTYVVAAKQYRPHADLLSPVDDSGGPNETLRMTVLSVVDEIREELQHSINIGAVRPPTEATQDTHGFDIASTSISLTEAQAAEFIKKMRDLLDETARNAKEDKAKNGGAKQIPHTFFYVVFPNKLPASSDE